MPARRLAPLLVLLLAAACESDPAPLVWDQPGDPCNSPAWCVGDSQAQAQVQLRECQDRRWVDVDCDERCAAEGLQSAGCQPEIQGARCLCEACPGPLTCLDESTIETCLDGAKVATACADYCAANGYDTAHGCRTTIDQKAQCQCSNAATCTVEGQARCVDATQLATCQSSVWSVVDCQQSCANEFAVCTYDPATGAHACDCARTS